ncbi:hypothetical protein HNQ37_000647 [Lactovum miscens]|uniref:Integrase n=1 Tax=Lactovum miscens TaxID=190387 RepID=A0A841C4M9_9LACT|nr:hypothetical protein [Lactovum miscens]
MITISNILGHKDLAITLQVYAHQIEALKEKIAIKLKKFLTLCDLSGNNFKIFYDYVGFSKS